MRAPYTESPARPSPDWPSSFIETRVKAPLPSSLQTSSTEATGLAETTRQDTVTGSLGRGMQHALDHRRRIGIVGRVGGSGGAFEWPELPGAACARIESRVHELERA